MQVISKYRSLYFSIFLVGGSLYLNLLFAKLDPEIHHDGIIFPAAVAASEGLVPNRDFFTQYGPLGPILQGFWIDLTSPTLLNLRNLSAFLITLSTVLVILLTYRTWGLFLSSLIATTSAIAYPIVLPAMLPWPTLITTNLILICMLILQRIETAEFNKHNKYLFYVIGVLLSIGFYVRLHLIAVLISLFVALFLKISKQYNPWIILFGFLNVIVVMTIYQLKTNSFVQFIEQCFLFPIGNYGGISKGTKATIVDLALFFMFLLYMSFLCIAQRFQRFYQLNRSRGKSLILFAAFSTTFFIIYELGTKANSLPVESRSFINPVYLFFWICEHFRFIIGYSSVGTLLFYIITVLVKRRVVNTNSTLIIAMAIGSLAQLYPSPDQLHVWWITPIAIVGISNLDISMFKLQEQMRIFIFALLSLQIFHAYSFLGIPRIDYPTYIYQGMRGDDMGINLTTQRASELMGAKSSYFHCAHGIYAAANGQFNSSSFDFVDWGPQLPNKLNKSGRHFSCGYKLDSLPEGIRIIWSLPRHDYYVWEK
jgi:hypothetical protein